MNSVDKSHARALLDALLILDPSGPDGFEGFLGIILAKVTGQPFRLAKSGSQRGRDGDSAFDSGVTYFEGKRYKEGLSKNDISQKLFDLSIDDVGTLDLWVLGATCEIASQTVTDARAFAAKHGFGIAILDWSPNDFGSLLVASVAAGAESKSFLSQQLNGKVAASQITSVLEAIDHFANHVDIPSRLDTLKRTLNEDVGLGHAKALNQAWLNRSFKSKVQARVEFGQPLAPFDPSGPRAIDRPECTGLTKAFSGVPERDIYAIIGEEGVGKSWLAAQSWSIADPKPLLILCPADDLIGESADDLDDFLIRKLSHQTGIPNSPQATARWRRRFKAWRANIPATSVRLTLVADGLNQPLKSDWGRWLDGAALHMKAMGGCLVLTTRPQHWAQLRQTLHSNFKAVTLAEWSIQDVKKILANQGVDTINIRVEVLESVRNPRLLGIAIELIQTGTIKLLEELNPGRLLFEHMRRVQQAGVTPLPALAFADLLKSLAKKVLARANARVTDDLRLFDTVHEGQLEAVVSSRFFSWVKGSASQYEIKPDGLNLALALHLVDQLEGELRNQRAPRERLAMILEPISALDETATVVLLATQIACLSEYTSPEIRSTLIEKFVALQNLPNNQADAFATLVKSAPRTFLQAAENVYLSTAHVASRQWLLYALRKWHDDPAVWPEILYSAERWLSFYSLAPERRLDGPLPVGDDAQVEAKRNKIGAEIQERQAALTEAERTFMQTSLVNATQPRFDDLSLFAFYLLAGRPLEKVAPWLVRWRFSYALNSPFSTPYAEFQHLLHYNCVDWQKTRSALLTALNMLPVKCLSRAGLWTHAGILYGTGDPEDAQKGAQIRNELTRDQEHYGDWALRENYCAVDPCDPSNAKPENVTATALDYQKIDFAKVAQGRIATEQEHFFNDARAAVVRFVTNAAIDAHRALAKDVLGRSEYARRQGVMKMAIHSAALTQDLALRFLSAGAASTAQFMDENDNHDAYLTAQFSVLLALPYLTSADQLYALTSMKTDVILTDLFSAVRRAHPEEVEHVLQQVVCKGDSHSLTAALFAIHASTSPITPHAASMLKAFIQSPVNDLRSAALALAASSADESLLQQVVDSGWHSGKLGKGAIFFEGWYGSTAICGALNAGLIEFEAALDRMNLSHFGFVAETSAATEVRAIAARIDAALLSALEFPGAMELPEIEIETPANARLAPPLASVRERAQPENLGWLSETQKQFNERQRGLQDSYDRFTSQVLAAKAHLIVFDLTFEGVKAIIGQTAEDGQRWLDRLNAAPDSQLRHLHHFALQLAVALSGSNNPLVPGFIRRVLALEPTIRHVTGMAKNAAPILILWGNANTHALVEICRERLRAPHNDCDLAREVIAAHLGGKVALVQDYINELLIIGRPYETALALTITGLCDESAHAEAVLSRFDGSVGFIGTAHAAARKSYAKNTWAKSWYTEMRSAESPDAFWRASVLMMKIVDGRFDIWANIGKAPSATFIAFMPTINREIRNRVAKSQKNLDKNLMGDKKPNSMMLNIH